MLEMKNKCKQNEKSHYIVALWSHLLKPHPKQGFVASKEEKGGTLEKVAAGELEQPTANWNPP